MSVKQQYINLLKITNTEYDTPQSKADAAKLIRNEIRNNKAYDIDGLFAIDEDFMNITLRDFLNTSDTGLDYTISDMDPNLGWTLVKPRAAQEHQRTKGSENNLKFVNSDGREAIFRTNNGITWTLVKGGPNASREENMDMGTYNYAKSVSGIFDWTSDSEHGRWDMDPFFRQWNYYPWYRNEIRPEDAIYLSF